MTAEQLEAARSERMRQNGHGAIAYEDVRTWIEETGLCVYLPRPTQAGQSSSPATPTFVEAVAGRRTMEPTLDLIQTAESLLVRLETEGVAVRLNLAGQPGEQPDYIVAGWVLPYIYALRGDRDWRRSPQLTGSRQVSPLAVQVAKHLEPANLTAIQLRDALGKEVTEAAVLRALHELWKQLRVIPLIPAIGSPALWQPLRQRFQKAIAEGASTSQVTAISVLASIYLQAVIAGSMEDVEMFLSPLTSRSKIREVVRGLAATRQVHTTSMGHASLYYVAGTLPDFPAAPSYASSPAAYRSSYMPSYIDDVADDDFAVPGVSLAAQAASSRESADVIGFGVGEEAGEEVIATPAIAASGIAARDEFDEVLPAIAAAPAHRPQASHTAKSPISAKAASPRPRPSRTASTAHPRERSRGDRSEGRSGSGSEWRRSPAPRAAGSSSGSRPASSSRPARGGSSDAQARHAGKTARPAAGNGHGHAGNGNGHSSNGHSANGHSGNGSHRTGAPKPASQGWSGRSSSNGNGNGNGAKHAAAQGNGRTEGRPASRNGSASSSGAKFRPAGGAKPTAKAGARSVNGHRTETRNGATAGRNGATAGRPGARPAAGKSSSANGTSRNGTSHKSAASASKRYSFAGQAKQAPKPVAKAAAGRNGKSNAAAQSRSKAARPAAAAKRRG